jgi:hypothetical protein
MKKNEIRKMSYSTKNLADKLYKDGLTDNYAILHDALNFGNSHNVYISNIAVHKMPWTVPEPDILTEPLCDIKLKVNNMILENFSRAMPDNGIGDTIRIDMGVLSQIEYVPEEGGLELQSTFDDHDNIKTCHLLNGGFKLLKVNSESKIIQQI